MYAKYVIAALAVVFLVAAATRLAAGRTGPQMRTWFIVGGIFACVSAWLFSLS